jgi:hypothetical protein
MCLNSFFGFFNRIAVMNLKRLLDSLNGNIRVLCL